MPTIDKWYYSSSNKYSIHNYATGYGYPIEFSGNAIKDTNSIEVSNRGYITGAGTTKPGSLFAYQEVRAEGSRTPSEKLTGYSSTKLTQENGKATFKNSAQAGLDTGYSPAISSIYMTQEVSNANGNLDMTTYSRSAPSYTAAQNYDKASVSTSIKGANAITESTSTKVTEATAQEWTLGGTHRMDAKATISGSANSASADSEAYFRPDNAKTNYYKAVSHVDWQLPGSGSIVALATTRNVKSTTYANAQSSAIMSTNSDKATAWTRTVAGNVGTTETSNHWKSGLWTSAIERTTAGDVINFNPSVSSEVRGLNFKSNANVKVNAQGIDTRIWRWNEASKSWNQLSNQYGMPGYYTANPVQWKFSAQDGSGDSYSLTSKAGDLNIDGSVTLSETVEAINMYTRGEVTKEYVDEAIKNWENS